MKTSLLLPLSAAAALALPTIAPAQRLSPTVIAVVDTDRVSRECAACKVAQTQLRSQLTSAQTRATQLRQPLQTEGAAIQAAVTALAGKRPDAALEKRARDFQAKQATAERELATREQTLRSTQAHVNQQIGTRLGPIITAVMTARGATVVVDKGATLAAAPSLDVTSDVIAQLDRQLPSVSVTPLPAQPQPARPQGR